MSRRKKGCKLKHHKKTLIVNGKKYHLKEKAYNKVDAESIAKDLRDVGYNALINKRTGDCFGYGRIPMYGVYARTRGR